MTNSIVRWGILGPGGIAKAFTAGLAQAKSGTLVAIGPRDPNKPGLAETFPGVRIVDGYQALLDDPEFQTGDYTIKWLEEWLARAEASG